ncbi:MAG: phosphoadenosine phosphosulfate reductase family protein [Methanomassiliicoccaceae archaeon]|nr:phosphoadenosine phosphosulfate reductase family protein [Methanomassiliicoccaceae archaeon]
MAAVRLGKNHLRWCSVCNLPVLEDTVCSVCGNGTEEVDVTPPGDVRPAFPHDIELIKKLTDEQFGYGSGDALLPDGQIVLLNKAPSLDRMDEIIINGRTVASIRYDIGSGWKLLNRMQSAMRIEKVMTKGYVICDLSAVRFIRESKNLMVPGVADVHPDVKEEDEVIIADTEGNVIATGLAKMSAADMLRNEKGLAVKTKWTKPEELIISDKKVTWDDAVSANVPVLTRRKNEAVAFINSTIEKNDVPAVVSFSGGKDSLATLLLTMDAGRKLPVLFIDTGLEFSETVEHVHDTARTYDLELIEEKAPVDAFFGNVIQFGPPAKDFRWCCKTNKLGPTVNAILKNFPDGVLSFIGQRKYESEARHSKPRVWTNPWTPGQTGASPIQSWNSLHVWMYIFWKKAEYNVWYTKGLDRIGCFLCPASDLAELDIIKENSRYEQWDSYLNEFSSSRKLLEEWKRFALWRWKRAPQSIKDEILRITGKDIGELVKQTVRSEGPLFLKIQDGYSPCVLGLSVEGAVSRSVNIEKLRGLAHILGKDVSVDADGQWLSVNNVTVFGEGSVISKGSDEKRVRDAMKNMFSLIVRSEQCVGCSLCVARCPQNALSLNNGVISLDPDKCTQCGKCLDKCPAVSFRDEEFAM